MRLKYFIPLFWISLAFADEPFLSEVRAFTMNFCPKGWAKAEGQLLAINQNQALFSLLGTSFGGNGQTNFALPDLRGRGMRGVGNGTILGQSGSDSIHTLTMLQMPAHAHVRDTLIQAGLRMSNLAPRSTQPDSLGISDNGAIGFADLSGADTSCTGVTSSNIPHQIQVQNVGGSQPFYKKQPTLDVTYCIALQGIFPSQN